MIDPRVALIERRLERIRRVVVFTGGTGGVGQSVCAATTALLSSRSGRSTGLLDLDLHGASAHVFLGVEPRFPDEDRGILPLECEYGLRLMSVAPFTQERGLPLRGVDITNAIIELLAVTVWGALDCLVVDLPPGFGDEVLDVLRFMTEARIVIVTTPSVVSVRVAEGLLRALVDAGKEIVGVIENLSHDVSPSQGVRDPQWAGAGPSAGRPQEGTGPSAERPLEGTGPSAGRPQEGTGPSAGRPPGAPLLAVIPYSAGVEEAIGSPALLVDTVVGERIAAVLDRLLS